MGNSLKATDLHRVLSDVRACASKEKHLPSIGVIRLEATEAGLIAAATDRFVLGVSRCDYQGEAFALSLSGASADSLIRFAKTAARDKSHRTAELELIDGGKKLGVTFSSGEALILETEDYEFPRYKALIPAADKLGAEVEPTVGLNAENLAKFAKVAGSHQMKLTNMGANKPQIVSIGSDFIGLVMPVRLAAFAESPLVPAWLHAG